MTEEERVIFQKLRARAATLAYQNHALAVDIEQVLSNAEGRLRRRFQAAMADASSRPTRSMLRDGWPGIGSHQCTTLTEAGSLYFMPSHTRPFTFMCVLTPPQNGEGLISLPMLPPVEGGAIQPFDFCE